MSAQVKIVGKSGQISLGKEYAGQQVLIEEIDPGEWRIRAAVVIPLGQAWVHTEAMQARLSKAIERVQSTAPRETDLRKLRKKLGNL
jgi:hypothetical protein